MSEQCGIVLLVGEVALMLVVQGCTHALYQAGFHAMHYASMRYIHAVCNQSSDLMPHDSLGVSAVPVIAPAFETCMPPGTHIQVCSLPTKTWARCTLSQQPQMLFCCHTFVSQLPTCLGHLLPCLQFELGGKWLLPRPDKCDSGWAELPNHGSSDLHHCTCMTALLRA